MTLPDEENKLVFNSTFINSITFFFLFIRNSAELRWTLVVVCSNVHTTPQRISDDHSNIPLSLMQPNHDEHSKLPVITHPKSNRLHFQHVLIVGVLRIVAGHLVLVARWGSHRTAVFFFVFDELPASTMWLSAECRSGRTVCRRWRNTRFIWRSLVSVSPAATMRQLFCRPQHNTQHTVLDGISIRE